MEADRTETQESADRNPTLEDEGDDSMAFDSPSKIPSKPASPMKSNRGKKAELTIETEQSKEPEEDKVFDMSNLLTLEITPQAQTQKAKFLEKLKTNMQTAIEEQQ
mmetsp:Transcript_29802/g.45456  ORF Transcript_29802/g.45456 Transcript_29802/m.45456 type:complete len:106 (+) Transcript_29802:4589-4906(+)